MSGETSFTPGPWTTFVGEDGNCVEILTSSRPQNHIATIGWGVPRHANEEAANASLIAAAPELYERLAILLSDIAAGDVSRGDVEAAKAVLAKARGER